MMINKAITATMVLGLVTLIGCGDEDDDTTDTEGGTQQAQPSVLDTCDESDFGNSPWLGAGFDDQGQLIAEVEGSAVVSVTVLQLREGEEVGTRFGALVDAMMPDLLQNEGLIGASLGNSVNCGTARTLTLWRDMESMMRFVTSDTHLEAMGSISVVSQRYKSTSVTVDAQELRSVDWAMQREILRAVPTQEIP